MVFLFMEKADKDKIAPYKKEDQLHLWSEFFQDDVICRDHSLSLVESMCPALLHPFHVYS